MTWWIFPLLLPTLLQGYIVGLLSLALGISCNPRFDGPVLQTDWRPWVERRWHYSTTIGAWMGLHSHRSLRTEWHEWVHVRQYFDMNVLGAILGGFACIVSWQLGLILWASSGPLWLVGNFLTGWLRHGDAYMGSEHELSAYAQTYEAYR
jgi:hypothetical protein